MTLPFQIKVCGITSNKDALATCLAGADAIGLNFYDRSARYVEVKTAIEIAQTVRNYEVSKQAYIQLIGVFVNETADRILEIQKLVGLDGIQLHGDENPEFAKSLMRRLPNCFFVKAIRTRPAMDQNQQPDVNELASVKDRIIAWNPLDVAILLDAQVSGEFGGTGKSVNWNLFPLIRNQVGRDLVLAGGLDPWNVGEAIQQTGSCSVDVASGVESVPGTKDTELIEKFVSIAKTAFNDCLDGESGSKGRE
ncbi:MAG: phosphoribosylanthranilate isomerase [Planctomycetota bacterium]